MKRRYLLFLNDIMESMNRINTYTEGVDYDSFSNNQMLMDAVIWYKKPIKNRNCMKWTHHGKRFLS